MNPPVDLRQMPVPVGIYTGSRKPSQIISFFFNNAPELWPVFFLQMTKVLILRQFFATESGRFLEHHCALMDGLDALFY